MAGRFAAVSHHTISDAIRDRFGFNFFLWPLFATLFVNFLARGRDRRRRNRARARDRHRLSMVGVALLAWLLLWKGTSYPWSRRAAARTAARRK
jgi:hypothetical protein